MTRSVWGDEAGRNSIGACRLTSTCAAPARQRPSLPRELGLAGSTSAGRVLFLAGHLNF